MVKKITKVTADSKKKKHRGSAGKNYMLTAESICLLLQSAEPTHSTSVAPRPMEVLIHYVVGLCPELYTNSNVPVQSPQNYQRLDWYKDTFLAGPRQFVFQCPRQSAKNSPPSPKYAIVSESKIGLIRWELLEGSNVWLRCSRCNDECVCDRLERITPVFDGQGKPMYLASYVYKCRQCALEISGISQEFITRLPLSIQQVFPCPPHWIKPGFRFLVTSSLASLIRDLLDKNPEHGAERVENYLHQMYDCMYTMDQARYLVACGGETSADRFPTFEEWFGPSMQIPTADELNELYDFAKEASSGTTVGLAPE